ncbi:hypothetical protein [Lysobacter sp. P5_B9]
MDLDKAPPAKPTLMTPWLVFAALVACLLVAIVAAAMLGISMPRSGWYFPPEVMPGPLHAIYRGHLDAMREPELRAYAGGTRVAALRILCVTAFGHSAAVRYTFDANGAARRAVQLQGYGQPGPIVVDRTDRLTRAQADALLASLDAAGYWDMAAKEESNGRDGLRIVVEAIRGSEHRVVDRWSPSYDTNERHLSGYHAFYRDALDDAGVGRKSRFSEQVCVE